MSFIKTNRTEVYENLYNIVARHLNKENIPFKEVSHELNSSFTLLEISDKVLLSINDNERHNSSITDLHISFHYKTYLHYLNKGQRVINLYDNHIRDANKWTVLKDIINHSIGRSYRRIYARDTDVVITPAKSMKPFFDTNNIQKHRGAVTAFTLVHKKNREPLMSYSVGHAFFGKGVYDAEIARGACVLGTSVIGGASKLWKFIKEYYNTRDLNNNPGKLNSIVYYVDINYYNGQSMYFLSGVETVKTQQGFWNYWLDTDELKNREPTRHSFIKEQIRAGKIWEIGNAGTQVNVWHRNRDTDYIEELN